MRTIRSSVNVIDDITNKILQSGYRSAVGLTGIVARLSRPFGSKKEDIVVNVVAINAEQVQEGVANVNIHVPDINTGVLGMQANFNRFRELITPMISLLDDYYGFNYHFRLDTAAEIIKDEDNSHYANIRLRYYSLRQDTA